MNKKIIIFVTAMVLAFAIGVGATLAYFTSFSGKVTNTFVSGGFATLSIEEIEDDGNKDITNSGGTNKYTVVPGKNLDKDPQVTFTFDSGHISNAYVFVKITYGSKWNYNATDKKFSATVGDSATGDTLADALTTTIDTANWAELTKGSGFVVLVYKGDDATNNITKNSFTDKDILKISSGTSITVSADLTETQCEWIKNSVGTTLNLDFKAYAIQSEGFAKASDAWAKVSTLG